MAKKSPQRFYIVPDYYVCSVSLLWSLGGQIHAAISNVNARDIIRTNSSNRKCVRQMRHSTLCYSQHSSADPEDST